MVFMLGVNIEDTIFQQTLRIITVFRSPNHALLRSFFLINVAASINAMI